MWDVLRAKALASQYAKKDSSLNDSTQTKLLTQKVFEAHHIKEGDFEKSYDWYIQNPESMKVMFDSLYAQKQRNNNETKISQHPIGDDSIPVKNILIKKSHQTSWPVDSLNNYK